MSKPGNRPLKTLEKLPIKQSRWTSNLAKVFVLAAATLLALSATVVICRIAFSVHKPQPLGSNVLAGVNAFRVPAFPATKMTTVAEKGNGGVTPLAGTNRADNGAIPTEHSVRTLENGSTAIAQTTPPSQNPLPTPAQKPISTPGPVPQTGSKALTSDSEFLWGKGLEFGLPGEKSLDRTGSKNVERQLPKSVRKRLEKKRQQAERKRSRLEDMYEKHLISSEAYKKGEQEYKSEIEKYRSEFNGDGGHPNSLD
jgi:hypothetical protein